MLLYLEELSDDPNAFANQLKICERVIAEYHLTEETSSKVRKVMEAHKLKTSLQIKSQGKKGKEIIYITNFIIKELPNIHGSSSLVFITGPKRIVQNPNIDYIWEAFGSFMRIPHAKYCLSEDNQIDYLKVEVLVFSD